MAGMVQMQVQDGDEVLLHYTFGSLKEASEMLDFLRDFLPSASFVIQPLRH